MQKKVTIKNVMYVMKLSVLLIWSWPLPNNATKLKTFFMRLYHFWCMIMVLCVELPLLYGISNQRNNLTIMVQQIVLASGCIHCIGNQIVYHSVINEMEKFVKVMKPHEEIVIQRYVDKCLAFYGTTISIFYVVVFFMIVGPILTHQPFPTLAEYPFDTSYLPLKIIIYFNQSYVGLMTSAHLCLNAFNALMLWYTSAKFMILIEDIRKTRNIYELFKCIQVHQELIEFAEEVTSIVGPFTCISIYCGTFSAIVAFLVFVTDQPLLLKSQFMGLSLITLLEVYMFAWPGEEIKSVSSIDMAQAVFDIYQTKEKSIKLNTYLQIMIMRSQKPTVVSIPCLLPALSHNSFATFCSTIMSYFTTLRVFLMEEE
ncbi:odorant receptor 47b isoform X2 [Monomorium pharaonis]|uniref:odorant receptor 47b isoform X2 n=1 Tax=Monomorium pharaonis TaxID=307658 RepID=UPI00063F2EC8|nr:odorant receptor 47b isoform X2 [Monomorium pharaonis]